MKKLSSLAVAVIMLCWNVAGYSQQIPDESFIVSGIQFGGSAATVAGIAKKLGLKLESESDYAARGTYPQSLAYQVFVKPCPTCSNFLNDPGYEALQVQYSAISSRVVAIARLINLEKPVHRTVMVKEITDRFGTQASSSPGQYAWRKNGSQERKFDADQHCGVLALPYMRSVRGCSRAASYVFTTDRGNSDLVISQSIHVFDWKKYDEEMVLVEKSEMDMEVQRIEESKCRMVPKI